MKAILCALLLAACIPCFAEPSRPEPSPSSPSMDKSVEDTLIRIRREKIKALEAYVAGHPKAEDGDEALKDIVADYGELAKHYQRLVDHDQKSHDKDHLHDALERQYCFMTKGGKPNLEDVCGNIVERFFLVWKGSRSTPEDQRIAQAVFDQGKKDFPALKDDPWFCRQESKLKWPHVGDELAIAFTALDGRKVDIAALKGKAVLVYFWASSVSDYNKFHPALKGTYEKFHDAGFEVIGISLDEDEAALRSFIKKDNIPGPQAFDGKGLKSDWVEKYGIIYTPFYFLFGRDGKFADYGGEGPELETKVAELMK